MFTNRWPPQKNGDGSFKRLLGSARHDTQVDGLALSNIQRMPPAAAPPTKPGLLCAPPCFIRNNPPPPPPPAAITRAVTPQPPPKRGRQPSHHTDTAPRKNPVTSAALTITAA